MWYLLLTILCLNRNLPRHRREGAFDTADPQLRPVAEARATLPQFFVKFGHRPVVEQLQVGRRPQPEASLCSSRRSAIAPSFGAAPRHRRPVVPWSVVIHTV